MVNGLPVVMKVVLSWFGILQAFSSSGFGMREGIFAAKFSGEQT